MRVAIAGAASRIDRQFADGIERQVREVVREALDAAALSLAEVDLVVTVASDTLDGMMVPIRAELAGALGKSYLNVPSAAGHAIAAAATAIEAGDAETVLVVGWGAASKLAGNDGRSNQFDPFFMRPAGATPKVLAALQRQVLSASGAISDGGVAAFEAQMADVVWPRGAAAGGLRPEFCDGVAAIVLTKAAEEGSGLFVADHATASRSHAPLDGSLDPAGWVTEALESLGMRAGAPLETGFVEASGSSAVAEMRAIAAMSDSGPVRCPPDRANAAGGGAAAWFGPATALRPLAELARRRLQDKPQDAAGIFVDLAGPLGQLVTAIVIEQRSAA
jgi:hypothetical protein